MLFSDKTLIVVVHQPHRLYKQLNNPSDDGVFRSVYLSHTHSARFSPAAVLKCPPVFSRPRGIFSSSCGLRRKEMLTGTVKAAFTSTSRHLDVTIIYIFLS